MNRYERRARADALRGTARTGGAAADMMTAGLGLGAGMNVARKMMGQTADPPPAWLGGPPCPKCRNPVQPEFILCPICRPRLKIVYKNLDCARMIDATWNVCAFCGSEQT